MKFEEATYHLTEEGGKIRQRSWGEGKYIYQSKNGIIINDEGNPTLLTIQMLLADDWEIIDNWKIGDEKTVLYSEDCYIYTSTLAYTPQTIMNLYNQLTTDINKIYNESIKEFEKFDIREDIKANLRYTIINTIFNQIKESNKKRFRQQ